MFHGLHLRCPQVRRGFVQAADFQNDEAHKLGKEPLPQGIVRLYRDMGNNALGYVGEVATAYIAKNDEIKVNAGTDAEVTLKLTRTSLEKKDLAFRRWGNGAQEQRLEGWTTVENYKLEIKNYRSRAVNFEVNLVFGGDFDFESETASIKVDYQTQRFARRAQGQYAANGYFQTHHP